VRVGFGRRGGSIPPGVNRASAQFLVGAVGAASFFGVVRQVGRAAASFSAALQVSKWCDQFGRTLYDKFGRACKF